MVNQLLHQMILLLHEHSRFDSIPTSAANGLGWLPCSQAASTAVGSADATGLSTAAAKRSCSMQCCSAATAAVEALERVQRHRPQRGASAQAETQFRSCAVLWCKADIACCRAATAAAWRPCSGSGATNSSALLLRTMKRAVRVAGHCCQVSLGNHLSAGVAGRQGAGHIAVSTLKCPLHTPSQRLGCRKISRFASVWLPLQHQQQPLQRGARRGIAPICSRVACGTAATPPPSATRCVASGGAWSLTARLWTRAPAALLPWRRRPPPPPPGRQLPLLQGCRSPHPAGRVRRRRPSCAAARQKCPADSCGFMQRQTWTQSATRQSGPRVHPLNTLNPASEVPARLGPAAAAREALLTRHSSVRPPSPAAPTPCSCNGSSIVRHHPAVIRCDHPHIFNVLATPDEFT